MINIIDVINVGPKGVYTNKPNGFYYLVLDKYPDFKYIQNGNDLIAEDSGFYNCYKISYGSGKAFGGAEFSIPLKNGGEIKAHGQVWSAGFDQIPEPYIDVGIAVLNDLKKSYGFYAGCISKNKLDAWLKIHTPSDNYNKYKEETTIKRRRIR